MDENTDPATLREGHMGTVSQYEQYRKVKPTRRILNRQCTKMKWNDDKSERIRCTNKTGVNYFFCNRCHEMVEDSGMSV